MHADQVTLNDLSIFAHEEELSILHHIDFTRTTEGREWLKYLLGKPLDNIKEIRNTQLLLQDMIAVQDKWPGIITNGTLMVLGKFFEIPIDEIPSSTNFIESFTYKFLHGPDYSLVKYSVTHFLNFIDGLHDIQELMQASTSTVLQTIIQRIDMLLKKSELQKIISRKNDKPFSDRELLHTGHFLKRHFKAETFELIDLYSRLDAYYSMGIACIKFKFSFPSFTESGMPDLQIKELFHPLLSTPVAYNCNLEQEKNFLFLTGANMAGKSTFIKAVGVAVYLAHIGMGVPASFMQLSFFDGLLSNIQVADNIVKGESYFFNEVQRIKKTLEKISDGKKWIILIDELFKGTNVQDAMKCSSVVIEGLLKMKNCLFILSTHLYEIGDGLRVYPNIQFRYFETQVQDGQLYFSYFLKEGISNDRLGYLILKKEGVVEMLQKL